MKHTFSISLSLDYLNNSQKKELSSIDWITHYQGEDMGIKEYLLAYCKANGIQIKYSFYWAMCEHFVDNEEEADSIYFGFKSERQADAFISNVNKRFPFFEVI